MSVVISAIKAKSASTEVQSNSCSDASASRESAKNSVRHGLNATAETLFAANPAEREQYLARDDRQTMSLPPLLPVKVFTLPEIDPPLSNT